METQKIQATITLTLTQEQLLALLNAAPAQVQTTAPTPAPAPAQMFAQPTPAPMPQAQPMAQAQPTPAPMPQAQIPAAQPQTYTVEQLGLAARPLVESGRREELVALLTEFGVPSVASIPEDKRADFAARLRAMGGQI